MKKYAPLATLVTVVLLGAVLLVVNMLSTPRSGQDAVSTAAAASATCMAGAPA